MPAPLTPHTFEPTPGTPYCAQCQLPRANQVHTVNSERTRVVLVIDRESHVSQDDLARVITQAFEPFRDITLFDLRMLP